MCDGNPGLKEGKTSHPLLTLYSYELRIYDYMKIPDIPLPSL